jgi:hypothetical protein
VAGFADGASNSQGGLSDEEFTDILSQTQEEPVDR